MEFSLHEAVTMVFGRRMGRMSHVVGLQGESKHVAQKKNQHDGHQNNGGLFTTLANTDLVLVVTGETGIDGLVRVDLISILEF